MMIMSKAAKKSIMKGWQSSNDSIHWCSSNLHNTISGPFLGAVVCLRDIKGKASIPGQQ